MRALVVEVPAFMRAAREVEARLVFALTAEVMPEV